MGSPPTSVDDALRAAVRAELDAFFEEKIKPLFEASRTDVTDGRQVRSEAPMYVSTADAAKMVGVSVATIQAWVRANRLRGHKAGRLLRFKVEDLQAFMTRAAPGEVVDLDAAARRIMLGGRRRSPSR
jgi:excisionase family DNA binding protein